MQKNFNIKQAPTDLNIYAPNEGGFANGSVVKQGVDLFIQEIQLLFDTEKGDIMGSDYGSDIRKYLYKLNVSENRLMGLITREIFEFCDGANEFEYKVDASFAKGQQRDICIVDISIRERTDTGDAHLSNFQYVFS